MSDVKGNGGPKLKFPSSCQCELLSDDCHGETRKKFNMQYTRFPCCSGATSNLKHILHDSDRFLF